MIFSLPSYRRLSEADLDRLRIDSDRTTTSRLARASVNILLLAGLWGVPLYARWMILPGGELPIPPREAIIGRWRATDSNFSLSFSSDGQFVLSWKETIVETAQYRFSRDSPYEIELMDFREQPGERAIREARKCMFRVSVTREKLSIGYPLDDWKRHDWDRRQWKIERDRISLPSVSGINFERVQ